MSNLKKISKIILQIIFGFVLLALIILAIDCGLPAKQPPRPCRAPILDLLKLNSGTRPCYLERKSPILSQGWKPPKWSQMTSQNHPLANLRVKIRNRNS